MSNESKGLDTKKVLKDAAQKKLKVKYNDRLKVKVVKDSKHLRKGYIFSPHKVIAEGYIKSELVELVKD